MRQIEGSTFAALGVAMTLGAWIVLGEAAALLPTQQPQRPLQESPSLRQLRTVKRLRHFLDKTDSEIATRIAHEAGLGAQVQDTAPARRVVLQKNLTDWEFLVQLAIRNGFRVWVDEREGILHFQKRTLPAPRR